MENETNQTDRVRSCFYDKKGIPKWEEPISPDDIMGILGITWTNESEYKRKREVTRQFIYDVMDIERQKFGHLICPFKPEGFPMKCYVMTKKMDIIMLYYETLQRRGAGRFKIAGQIKKLALPIAVATKQLEFIEELAA